MAHSNWNCPQCHNQNISGELMRCPNCGKLRNRWGYWDCRYCGGKQIRADKTECPGCGKPKDRDVKFYLHDDSPVEFVDEISGESAVRVGRENANWICPYCRQQNDASATVCVYCSAAREESQERYFDVSAPAAPAPAPTPAPEPQPVPQYPKVKRPINKSKLVCCLILILIPIVLFGAAFLMDWLNEKEYAKTYSVQPDDIYWTANVWLEELKTFEGSDWTLPSDARELYTRQEEYTYIDHYERRSREVWEPDDDYGGGGGGDYGGGYNDYGNGQFGMFRFEWFPAMVCNASPAAWRYRTEYYDEPVYATEWRTKYYYEYDRWVEGRTITTTGGPDIEPYYGDVMLSDLEREKNRNITFYVNFNHKGKAQQIICNEADWYRIADNDMLYYHVRNAYSDPVFEICFPD